MVSQHNPAWTWDETVLAYEVLVREYLGGAPQLPDRRHTAVVDLSDLLHLLPIHPVRVRQDSFRNPNGVARKLGNLLYVHTTGDRGSGHHSGMDERVVAAFREARGPTATLRHRTRNPQGLRGR